MLQVSYFRLKFIVQFLDGAFVIFGSFFLFILELFDNLCPFWVMINLHFFDFLLILEFPLFKQLC